MTALHGFAIRSGRRSVIFGFTLLMTKLNAPGTHNHAPTPGSVEAAKITTAIRKRAGDSMDPTRNIIADNVAATTPTVAAALPAESSMRRTIQRVRARAINALANPQSLIDLQIPQEYQETKTGQSFLFFDSGPAPDRIIIYATENGLDLLSQSDRWFADGTFSVTPPLFQQGQLYTIHALVEDTVFPCVFALMPGKDAGSYQRMIGAIQARVNLQPHSILTDFEQAAISVFRVTYPGTRLIGCFFHLAQSCWRKVQEFGMQQQYVDDEEFSILCRMVPALAFVPTGEVIQAFRSLAASIPVGYDMEDYLKYFERTYIGRIVAGTQRDPIFPVALWNQYQNVLQGLPRTNNAVEGWHNAFHGTIGGNHPTYWRFVEALKKEESLHTFRLQQLLAGVPPPAKKKKYMDMDSRIATRVAQYGNVNLLIYLRGLAHAIRF